MPHSIERAATGRAKCRGCGGRIAAGELRFGERLPNPFADDAGEMTHWFHVPCAGLTRPEAFLETLPAVSDELPDRAWLEHEAALGAAHHRLPRVRAVERAATGRASCRACREPIAKDAWRIALQYYEDGRFVPSGFIHARCAPAYLETGGIMRRVRHFTPGLSDEDAHEIAAELAAGDTRA